MPTPRGGASPSIPSAIKAYAVHLILLSLSVFYQLVIIPRSFPPSHYHVLGIKRRISIEEVTAAYEKVSSKWNSGVDVLNAVDFLEIQYAYELLKNPFWKRDYDIFGFDEQRHVLDKLKEQHAGESFSRIALPLLDAMSPDPGDHGLNVISSEDFGSMFNNPKPWLLQDETARKQRERRRNASNKDVSPSITDEEPKDAYQMPMSDSDSD